MQDLLKLQQTRSWLQPDQGTLGGRCSSLSLSLPSFIPPSSISLSSGLASGFCSQVSFYLNPLFLFISSFDFIHLLSSSLNADLSLWLSGVLPPSLYLSLSIAGFRVSLSCIRPSVCPSVRMSVCLSVRQAGGGPRHVRRVLGPSLPARLVVLSQSLCRAAHLCEALGVRV